jgi:predicted DNA-binding transcriptional regulator AlpA
MSGNRSKPYATAQLVKLGLPPRLLDLEMSAAYVGLSASAFLGGVKEGRYPAPIQDGKRKQWDRKALDAAIDRRSGLTSSSTDPVDEMLRAIDAA